MRDQRKGKVSESEMAGREEIQLIKGKEEYQSVRELLEKGLD